MIANLKHFLNIEGVSHKDINLKQPFNAFVPNAPFLYPLKISENLTVFWCFQGVEKEWIGNEWVKLFSHTWIYVYHVFQSFPKSFIKGKSTNSSYDLHSPKCQKW